MEFDQNDLSVQLGEIKLMEAGQPLPFDNAVSSQEVQHGAGTS